jgi:FlaA1/EpsC-like NDP-sugar epimerase
MLIPDKNTPRWIIFLIDMGICLVSLSLAYLLRFDFVSFPIETEWAVLKYSLPVFIAVRALTFYFGKTYSGIIRYTSTQDSKRIFIYVTLGSVLFALLVPVRFYLFDGFYFLPVSIIIMDYLCTVFLMITFRIMVKLIYSEQKNPKSQKRNVVIYGAGEMGLITKRTLDRDATNNLKVVGFLDDNSSKQGKFIESVPILHPQKAARFFSEKNIKSVIVAILNPDPDLKRMLIDECLSQNIEVLTVPPFQAWINGGFDLNQIRKVKIEDLLGRKPIQLEDENISKDIAGKVILVTGAAGSIGSEISRQLCYFHPKKIYLLDQAESPLYDLENELKSKGFGHLIEAVIADITFSDRMRNVFKTFRPQLVYHAAAYKHVPMMEMNPSEAIHTNVGGSKNLADLSVEFGVDKFVMISTDKAVNPTNVMGATKRLAEKYVKAKNKEGKTKFVSTRFGNVLGSNGSVIPLFKKQIESGGPVTVTHPEVTRFFMTIPEACRLVLEAGTMGKGGEIYLFDMGQSIKIADLARKMILLSGFIPDQDIKIEFTGLRPGEKLYEELLTSGEKIQPTHHPQIMISKEEAEEENLKEQVENLIRLYNIQNNLEMVRGLKKLIPEYVSNNSEYEKLDSKK